MSETLNPKHHDNEESLHRCDSCGQISECAQLPSDGYRKRWLCEDCLEDVMNADN